MFGTIIRGGVVVGGGGSLLGEDDISPIFEGEFRSDGIQGSFRRQGRLSLFEACLQGCCRS